MKPIKMVDLELEQHFLGPAIEKGIFEVLRHTQFIRGPEVTKFAQALSAYLSLPGEEVHVIPCANGTDALQLALMALGIGPGDEVIVPAFTYVSTAEVARLLGVSVRWVDVSLSHFNLLPEALEAAYAPRVKAIVPVHLFGQAAPMEPILEFARKTGLYVIEDVAQALGASYYTPEGPRKLGTLGDVGCTSFFPSKNLGCYGDGGAIFTRDAILAEKIARMANHGQSALYEFVDIGVNSRLDSLQAAILLAKLPYLDEMNARRQAAAAYYDARLRSIPDLILPERVSWGDHIFHQYTLRVRNGQRDALRAHLQAAQVPAMIYYPKPLHLQPAYQSPDYSAGSFPNAERLATEVLSLPIHPFLQEEQLDYITTAIERFFG